jgi:hypothetical protein
LAGELGPCGVADGTGEVPIAKEIGDGEVFQAEPVVGLDELIGDLMQIVLTDVGDASVLSRQPPDHLGMVGRARLGAGCGTGTSPQADHAVLERLGGREAADLHPGGGGRYDERGKSAVHPDESSVVIGTVG